MKASAILVLLLVLASPLSAAVIHDESVDGDISTNPAAPTAVVFAPGGNTIIGTVSDILDTDRDYITFTIAPGQSLTQMNLLVYTPDDTGFLALNAGPTSVIPSPGTAAFFLAGLHVSGEHQGTDLLPTLVCCAITPNSLPAPSLGPGTYCFMIQQTGAVVQSYAVEFVVSSPLPTDDATWGAIKALYR
jgi:hypothetical protein